MKLQGDYALRPNPLDGVIYFECPECRGPLVWAPDETDITNQSDCPYCGQGLTVTRREYQSDGRYETRFDLEAWETGEWTPNKPCSGCGRPLVEGARCPDCWGEMDAPYRMLI